MECKTPFTLHNVILLFAGFLHNDNRKEV